jgi:hypothetical protein
METHENSSLLQGLKHRIQKVSPPDGSDEVLIQRVMQSSAFHPVKTPPDRLATLSIVTTWMLAASLAFFLVFYHTPTIQKESVSSEQHWLEEELFEISNDEIQSWIAESRSEISQDAILTEITEHELYSE